MLRPMTQTDSCIDSLIAALLVREGGFVDHPADRGGPTNMGITLPVLASWREHPVNASDVKSLSREEASQIYRYRFWEKPGFALLELDPVVEEMIFDTAVHSGPARAVMFLQECVSTRQDGILGPITRAAAAAVPQPRLAARYIAVRTHFLGRLITRSPSQAAFAAGWMKRMAEFIETIPNVRMT